MSDERIQNHALFFQIKSSARRYQQIRAMFLEEQQRLVYALQNYGAIDEADMEPIGEKNSEIQEIISISLDKAAEINSDASSSP